MRTAEGWLYLAVVLELFLRSVIGWTTGHRLTVELAERALTIALVKRNFTAGLLHYADLGSQCAVHLCKQILTTHGLTPSMSRTGNYWDNVCVDSVFGTFKRELVFCRHDATREAAQQDVSEYIEVFHNRQRRRSSLGYDSPAEFEARTSVDAPGAMKLGEGHPSLIGRKAWF